MKITRRPPARRRDQLVLDHLWLARQCAQRFSRRGEPLDDLVQAATVALIEAAERYDPSRGVEFTSFAYPSVLGALRRHFRDRTWRMHVPRRVKDLAAALPAAIDHLTHVHQRSPRPRELAEHLGRSLDEVLEALAAREVTRPASLDAVTVDGAGRNALAWLDEDLAGSVDRMTVLAAAAKLDARRRRILVWRYYEGCSQSEIGQRLGVGQAQVSKLLSSAVDELRRSLSASNPPGETPT